VFAAERESSMLDKLLPLFSTLGGALIGALVAYLVARQQFKASVLSTNRQEWINKLRDLLAQYEAKLYNVHANFRLDGALRDTASGISVLPQNLWVDFRIWRPEHLPG
jgi:hypothetical protein